MSRKHEQRTRAQILAKRATPIQQVRVQRQVPTPQGPIWVPQPTSSERLRTDFNSSKYKPHFGAKEQERAKRLYMSGWLNESVAQFHPQNGHMRVSPTLCQIGKATHAAYLEAREQEYESVF
ncbi:hypothetical protein QF001_000884 [Paraburkholderia youngii]|uniref:hypothetical protein n=1 Tax=Paraburkholderia youngii TaxID=2782701 RepID=UPI003D20DE05